jgi:hypothetical protein
MLQRLEEDYELISKKRPILSKERSQNVRYEIADNFMRFWFRYVARHQNLIQMGLSSHISSIAISDYPTYSGYVLEEWFRQKMKESGEYENIGSWWNTSKGKHVEQSEVDIVAIPIDKKRPTIVAEVKRQRKNFKPELLKQKAEYLRTSILVGENISEEILTLEDM